MVIKSLEELRRVDDRALAFTPMGLGLDVRMRPEAAAEYQQQLVAGLNLDPVVGEGTRQAFDHLRTVFVRGVLCYEIYTLVNDHALLVIEQALRERFVEFHQATLTFVDGAGADHLVEATRYEHVQRFLRSRDPGRNHRGRRCWRLRLPDGTLMNFNSGMLGDLRQWARRVGLLRGQRNRGVERALGQLRDLVAHPNGYHLTGPVQAVGTLSDLAEIINQLWGVPTPGGRLYPAPLRREVVVMAWPTNGEQIYIVLADEAFADFVDPDDSAWQCVILRTVAGPHHGVLDPNLYHWDSRFEVTRFPVDLLFGPGTITEAAAWYAQHKPRPDDCDYFDRTFLIRYDEPDLYLPMRPEVAAALPDTERGGTWYTVKADTPEDAYHHVHNLITKAGCGRRGPCHRCHAERLGDGLHPTALSYANYTPATGTAPPLPNDVRTPLAHPRTRQIPANQRTTTTP